MIAGRSRIDHSLTVQLRLDAESPIPRLAVPSPALVVRCEQKQTDVYLDLNSSLQPESGKRDQATVTFHLDDEPAWTDTPSPSSDRTALFLPDPIPLALRLARHDRLLLGLGPLDTVQEVEFDLRGLARALPLVAEPCGWKLPGGR